MATNFPGPYLAVIRYTGDGNPHTMALSCDTDSAPNIGDAPSTIALKQRGGGTIALDTAVAALCAAIAVVFNQNDTFDSFDFYSVASQSFVRTWITSGDISDTGDSANPAESNYQSTYTYRTTLGGIGRLVLLEPANVGEAKQTYSQSGANKQSIFDYLLASTNWIIASDGGYPIAALYVSGGQNEALWRKVYRP